MRQFAKVSPQFWTDSMGQTIRQQGIQSQLIALYLMTNTHANMIGVYYYPIAYIAHDTGCPIEARRS